MLGFTNLLTNRFSVPKESLESVLDHLNVTVETLGREHSGKTGAKAMMFKITQGGQLPSGLELSALDPRMMVRLMNESIQTYQGLQYNGFISTIEPKVTAYHLFESDTARAILQLRESVGQLLTFTDEASDQRLQEQYTKHLAQLAKADVIHIFVSCPADNSPENVARLQNDLTNLMPNLRAILNTRQGDRKVAVALILTKADGAFATPEEAKAALTDDNLRGMFSRIVRLLEGSERVGLAAIIVLSAFGYGKARILEAPAAAANAGKGPARGFSLLSQGEPEWILKEGMMPEPHNLTELVWWTLMAGLALKKADHHGEELARTVKMLQDDLKAMNAWFVPLNCRANRK
jgi:hypothetical protein